MMAVKQSLRRATSRAREWLNLLPEEQKTLPPGPVMRIPEGEVIHAMVLR